MLTKMFLFESRFINADNGGPFETLQSATFGGPCCNFEESEGCNPQRVAVGPLKNPVLLTRSVAPCQQMERVFNLPLALSMIK